MRKLRELARVEGVVKTLYETAELLEAKGLGSQPITEQELSVIGNLAEASKMVIKKGEEEIDAVVVMVRSVSGQTFKVVIVAPDPTVGYLVSGSLHAVATDIGADALAMEQTDDPQEHLGHGCALDPEADDTEVH